MWYMGGKFRQRKGIVEAIRQRVDGEFTYVEPFCGGMWSATAVCDSLHPSKLILNDVNRPLMELWKKVVNEGTDWIPTDIQEIERNYSWYKNYGPEDDPLTAWYGVACSFGGKWFGGVARSAHITSFDPQKRSTERKANSLRPFCPNLTCESYLTMDIPDGSVVYCDPPYEGRTKAHHFNSFDYKEFWSWVRLLSSTCTVMVSCFACPDDFVSIYEWGDTVVRHNHGKGTDGTNEKLVMLQC